MADNANDVNTQAAPQEPAAPAPSTEETKAPAKEAVDPVLETLKSNDDELKAQKQTPKATKQDKPETEAREQQEAPAEETEGEQPPKGKAEDRKQQLNTEIRDLVSQRNALKSEVEQLNSQVYQPATEQELQEQGMSQLEAKVEAMRQQQELERYTSQVADAQLTIESESQRVLSDFPIFNPDSDQYKADIAAQASQLLQANLVYDQNTGQVIGSNVSPYQLYQTLAQTYQASQAEGQIQGQKATEKMLASADIVTSTAPRSKRQDPILEILKADD